jgi:hypothetical protein
VEYTERNVRIADCHGGKEMIVFLVIIGLLVMVVSNSVNAVVDVSKLNNVQKMRYFTIQNTVNAYSSSLKILRL